MEHRQLLTRSFDVLSNYRRRLVLYHLLNSFDGVAHQDALAEIIIDETDGLDLTNDAHHRVMTSLIHIHLPRLADMGLIEIDHDERIIHLQPLPETVERLLERSTRFDHRLD